MVEPLMKAISFISFYLSILSLVSCGTTQIHEMSIEEVKIGKKSIIRTNNIPMAVSSLSLGLLDQPDTSIISINNKSVDMGFLTLNQQVAVSPGKHSIKFKCEERDNKHTTTHTETIEMLIKPYVEYSVSCWIHSGFQIKRKLSPYKPET